MMKENSQVILEERKPLEVEKMEEIVEDRKKNTRHATSARKLVIRRI